MYENYAATSQNYDLTRTPVGVEVLLGCFATAENSLGQLEMRGAGRQAIPWLCCRTSAGLLVSMRVKK